MDLFSRADLTALAGQPHTVTVSLYLPARPERLAELVRHAEHELAREGIGARETDDILAPAHALAGDTGFWRRAADGVAVFLRAGWSRVFRLPLAFDEPVVVSDRCHVLPLLPLLAGDARYFLLALGKRDARLLAGTSRGLTAVPVPDMPYGHDAVADLRVLDRAVSDALHGHDAPLVLAGVARTRAAYRDITTYPHVLRTGVPGCPDGVSAVDLHRRAWPAVADGFTRARTAAEKAYLDALGTAQATADLAEAVAAAKAGRVATLFLPVTPGPGDRDGVEAAAVGTIRAGGTVYVVPDVPGPGPAAVVTRP